MRSASYQQSSYGSQSLCSRGISAIMALAIGVLLILAMVTLGVLPDRLIESNVLATFDVRPKAETDSRSAPKAAARVTPTRRPEIAPPVPVPPTPPMTFPPEMIMLSRKDFAAADIAKIARSPRPDSADSESGDSAGTGPNGQRSYYAQWYREPTDAEWAAYAPKRKPVPGDWGVIICRTVERYRVEDCREEGESPGSGLAGMMRKASWQFLIRPPRKGGKQSIGAWVPIRYEVYAAKE